MGKRRGYFDSAYTGGKCSTVFPEVNGEEGDYTLHTFGNQRRGKKKVRMETNRDPEAGDYLSNYIKSE